MKQNDRKNLEQRQREIEQRLDPDWQPDTAKPVMNAGNIHYEMSGRIKGIKFGGIGLIIQLVKSLRLTELIDKGLSLLQRHRPYHESDHVLNLVYNIMTGGEHLEGNNDSRLAGLQGRY